MSYTLQIGSSTYDVYADLIFAEEYLLASISADGWRGATETVKARALVSASRVLDRQLWIGEKTSEGQPLMWPRTDVEDVDDNEIPVELSDACCELAVLLIDGSDVQTQQTVANAIKAVGAGSARVEYFRGAEGLPIRFPLPVQELIRKWLLGSSSSVNSTEATDTCTKASDFDFDLSGA